MEQNGTCTSRAGWRQEETERLFALAEAAQNEGTPLKRVFDQAARELSRRPNSVRNFYYARVRASASEAVSHKRAFEPFTKEEAERLMREVLTARARGESVRSCTLRMAGGSDKAMLRYQNKYRAMLAHNGDEVRRIHAELVKAGIPALDPFAVPTGKHAGRPRKAPAPANAAYAARVTADRKYLRVLRALEHVEGLNLQAFLESLGALATSALRGDALLGGAARTAPEPAPNAALREENDALKKQLLSQHERYRLLLGYLTRLIRVNSAFLSEHSTGKAGSLSDYIRELEMSLRNCEQLVSGNT